MGRCWGDGTGRSGSRESNGQLRIGHDRQGTPVSGLPTKVRLVDKTRSSAELAQCVLVGGRRRVHGDLSVAVLFNPAAWAPAALIWSFLLLLPFSRSAELPMFIMAVLGASLVWKHGRQATWEGGAKLFTLLFLCIWVPIAR